MTDTYITARAAVTNPNHPFQAAYLRVASRIEQVRDDELVTLETKIAEASLMVALDCERLLEEYGAALSPSCLAACQEAQTVARAVSFLDVHYVLAFPYKKGFAQDEFRAKVTRDLLLGFARTYCDHHRVLSDELLEQVETVVATASIAASMALLVQVFKDHWSALRNPHPLLGQMVEQAERQLPKLLKSMAEIEYTRAMKEALKRERDRALRLFVDATRVLTRELSCMHIRPLQH